MRGDMEVKTMEVKKAPTITAPKADESPITTTRALDFVGEVKAEFKRINWPSADELKVYTKIVVAMTFLLGMGIYFMDVIIQSIVGGLTALFHLFG
jgi:preprotein translocase subunit SecE